MSVKPKLRRLPEKPSNFLSAESSPEHGWGAFFDNSCPPSLESRAKQMIP